MDSLTPLLILAAQQAVKEADENRTSSLSLGSALVAACAPVLPSLSAAVATSVGLLPLISCFSKPKPAEKRTKSSKGKAAEEAKTEEEKKPAAKKSSAKAPSKRKDSSIKRSSKSK